MERHHRVYLAPMVDGSELAFRMLCRAHGACAAYTPMLRAGKILLPGGLLAAGGAAGARVEEDRPLIVQLCGREPLQLAAAAKALLTHYHGQLDGIDLNLGCPQEIARREGIGAFLAADQALACRCVAALAEAVAGTDVAISAKIRLVEPPEEEEGHSRDPSLYLPQNPGPQNQGSGADREEGVDGKEAEPTATAAATVAFARRLVSAGCSLLACHCRRRDDKHNGPPDLVTGSRARPGARAHSCCYQRWRCHRGGRARHAGGNGRTWSDGRAGFLAKPSYAAGKRGAAAVAGRRIPRLLRDVHATVAVLHTQASAPHLSRPAAGPRARRSEAVAEKVAARGVAEPHVASNLPQPFVFDLAVPANGPSLLCPFRTLGRRDASERPRSGLPDVQIHSLPEKEEGETWEWEAAEGSTVFVPTFELAGRTTDDSTYQLSVSYFNILCTI